MSASLILTTAKVRINMYGANRDDQESDSSSESDCSPRRGPRISFNDWRTETAFIGSDTDGSDFSIEWYSSESETERPADQTQGEPENQTEESTSDKECKPVYEPECAFKEAGEYYERDDPLILEIRKRLEGCADGIILEGLREDAHKLKVLYEVLTYYKIPASIMIDGIIVDPDSVDKRSRRIYAELLENVKHIGKEALISLNDLIYEDYQKRLSREQLIVLMDRWVQIEDPSEGDKAEVLESFDQPIEANVVKRMDKRRARLMKDKSEEVRSYSKENMTGLREWKGEMFEEYGVDITDEDLRNLIGKWAGSWTEMDELDVFYKITGETLRLESFQQLGAGDCTKEELLEHRVGLAEHHFIELFMIWLEKRRPRQEEVTEVWRSIKCEELCGWLEWDVIQHMWLTLDYTEQPESGLAAAEYRYQYYWWDLTSSNCTQLLTKGYFRLCSSGGGNSATYCQIDSCNKGTHPCYTIAAQDDKYVVKDSDRCATRGLVRPRVYKDGEWVDIPEKKGEHGHSHSASVTWCWLYAGGYHSLTLSSKQTIDAAVKEWLESGRLVSVYVMLDPRHQD